MTDALLTTTMRRALDLADRGPAADANPRVGCVILSDAGEVLGEGWHRGAGTDHAEVDALAHVPDGDARGATVVVTLEPCAHVGRTGACAEALIDAGVTRVVYAVDDPGPVSGGGAERLRNAGIDVEGGLLDVEVATFLRIWLASGGQGPRDASLEQGRA
jgi:diaminohydroxyphosphoribosylaminopyrimidine deaminase/5-amino-6-(5-phosphoribosylamino)uracil reductase